MAGSIPNDKDMLSSPSRRVIAELKRKEIRIGVAIIVQRRDGKILFTTKPKIGDEELWSLPGGRIKYGESPDEAAQCAVFQETGVRSGPYGSPMRVLSHIYPDGAHHIILFYRTEPFVADEKKRLFLRPYKVNWFGIKELPKPQLEPLGRFIKQMRSRSML